MKQFLLIDDDEIICIVHPAIIRQAFPDSQINIIKSSIEALEYLKTLAATNEPAPDVIFLDINLPQMSGFELLEKLSEEDINYLKNSKIYMLSSSIDQRDLDRVAANKMVIGFVGKPLSMDFMKSNF
jgi:CheY-like chemotaxis protein